ncbi:MAG TPA: thiamine pyrophosphate-dependent dehydrogenase E1 component subunit alpha [Pseudolysinimonas sp.]|nr:thiamine pyrophosphate-dependent dehydrogenase E1 component subunit alpha [Pseudolysinimonas sp.]
MTDDVRLYERMCLMRSFEEACASGVRDGLLRGELHLAIGHEGVGVALEESLRPADYVVATHRSHLAAIAAGVPLRPMLAEIYERATGLSSGKGGHLHLFDPERRFSSTGIVGSTLPVALGHAAAIRLAGEDAIAVGITGDGGTNSGQFAETLNMATLWKLPLLVIVEDNGWGISVAASASIAPPGIAARARAYGLAAFETDATDPLRAVADAAEAFAHVRSGAGPALLVATCHRFSGHYEGDPDLYRTTAEKTRMRELGDPIANLRAGLIDGGADPADLDERAARIAAEIEQLRREVLADSAPPAADAFTDVVASITPGGNR